MYRKIPEIEYIFEEKKDLEELEIEYIVEEEVKESNECVNNDGSALNITDQNYYAIKKSGTKCSTYKKTHKKEFSTSKSCAKNIKVLSNIISHKAFRITIDQMYQIALKSIISSVVLYYLKEILIEILKFINTIYLKLKDYCLNTIMLDDTVKKRELAWENITKKVQEILLSLLQAVNIKQKSLLQISSPSQTV